MSERDVMTGAEVRTIYHQALVANADSDEDPLTAGLLAVAAHAHAEGVREERERVRGALDPKALYRGGAHDVDKVAAQTNGSPHDVAWNVAMHVRGIVLAAIDEPSAPCPLAVINGKCHRCDRPFSEVGFVCPCQVAPPRAPTRARHTFGGLTSPGCIYCGAESADAIAAGCSRPGGKEPSAPPVQITDAWFDGAHPNDLHPIGLVIDPIRRVVEVGEERGVVGDWIVTGGGGVRTLRRGAGPLSEAERAKRAPPQPASLVGAVVERAHVERGRLVGSVRVVGVVAPALTPDPTPRRMGAVLCEPFRSYFCAACGGIAMPYNQIPGEPWHIFGCLDCNTWLDRCCKPDCPHEPTQTPREVWPTLPFNAARGAGCGAPGEGAGEKAEEATK